LNTVFITGGTGYVGRPLIAELIGRGFNVTALVRSGSKGLPAGATAFVGNALDASTFASAIPHDASLVHLVGTPHPSPAKAAEFVRVDLASIRASTEAARQAAVRHFVYVSVAHPAPVMRAFIAVRRQGEELVVATGIPATILRPWYILGPGHRWPYLLLPMYAACRLFPSTRAGADRLGLVSLRSMVAALVHAVESPPSSGLRVMNVPDIRRAQA